MSQRKREFDSVRDMWEAKACSGSPGAGSLRPAPSPSPSSRLAKLPKLAAGSTPTTRTYTSEYVVQRELLSGEVRSVECSSVSRSDMVTVQIDVESAMERDVWAAAAAVSDLRAEETKKGLLHGPGPVFPIAPDEEEGGWRLAAAGRSPPWATGTHAENAFISVDEQEEDDEEGGGGLASLPETTDDEGDTDPVQEEAVEEPAERLGFAGQQDEAPVGMGRGTTDSAHSLADEEESSLAEEQISAGAGANRQALLQQPPLVSSTIDDMHRQNRAFQRTPPSVCSPVRSSPRSSVYSALLDIPRLDWSECGSNVRDDKAQSGGTVPAEDSPHLMGLRQHVAVLEAEADYQETVVDQIRRTINAAEKGSAGSSTDRSIATARVEAERTILTAARKRKGCLAQALRIKEAIGRAQQLAVSGQSGTVPPRPLLDPDYSARLTFRGLELTVNGHFLADLHADTNAEFFVVVMLTMFEQVYATEAVPVEDFDAKGRLLLSNLMQFVEVQASFVVEVEAVLIRIGRSSGNAEGKGHHALHPTHSTTTGTPSGTGGFLKRIMAALPKSASKGSDSPASGGVFRPASTDLTNIMSLGSVRLNVDNYSHKQHMLSEALLVQEYRVLLETDVAIDVEITVPFAAFLTFHCFSDVGSRTDWIRRWCVLRGSALVFWRYPDDVEKGVTPLCKLDLRCSVVGRVRKATSQECARPNCFLLPCNKAIFASADASVKGKASRPTSGAEVVAGHDEGQPLQTTFEYFVAADSKDALSKCIQQLNAVQDALHRWRLTASPPFAVHAPRASRMPA